MIFVPIAALIAALLSQSARRAAVAMLSLLVENHVPAVSVGLAFPHQLNKLRQIPKPIALHFPIGLMKRFWKDKLDVLMLHFGGLRHGDTWFQSENVLKTDAVGFLGGLSPPVFQGGFRRQHCQVRCFKTYIPVLRNSGENEIWLARALCGGPLGKAQPTGRKNGRQVVFKRVAHPRHPTLRGAFHEAEKAFDVLLVVNEKTFVEPSRYEKMFMAAEKFFFMIKPGHDGPVRILAGRNMAPASIAGELRKLMRPRKFLRVFFEETIQPVSFGRAILSCRSSWKNDR